MSRSGAPYPGARPWNGPTGRRFTPKIAIARYPIGAMVTGSGCPRGNLLLVGAAING